jgi:hypothetical protein
MGMGMWMVDGSCMGMGVQQSQSELMAFVSLGGTGKERELGGSGGVGGRRRGPRTRGLC